MNFNPQTSVPQMLLSHTMYQAQSLTKVPILLMIKSKKHKSVCITAHFFPPISNLLVLAMSQGICISFGKSQCPGTQCGKVQQRINTGILKQTIEGLLNLIINICTI